jgi:KDO2-lipid IV(A) lauroyltransferase
MAWTSTELRDYAIYLGLRALPIGLCSAFGAMLGRGKMGRLSRPAADARGRAAMALLRPDLATPERIAASTDRLWSNIGRLFCEFAVLPRILASRRATMADPALFNAIYADPRPIIWCFVHTGSWEVLGGQVANHPAVQGGRSIAAIVMPPANRAHAKVATNQRAYRLVDLIPMDAKVWHRLAEKLRHPGGVVWLAADEIVDGVVMAPHFGRRLKPNGNMGKIIRLAAATGARVVPIYNERRDGAQFVSHILPPLDIPHGRLGPDGVLEQVARLDAVFAPIVRKHLDQWLWTVDLASTPDDPISPSVEQHRQPALGPQG